MIKTTDFIFILIIGSLLLVSCKKEKTNTISYPITYRYNNISEGNIIIHTKNGSANASTNILNTFLYDRPNFFSCDSILDESKDNKIKLISESKALLINGSAEVEVNVKHINGILYFEHLDTVYNNYYAAELYKYSPVYMNLSNSNYVFGTTYIKYLPCMYGIESNGMIQIFLMSYIHKKSDAMNSYCSVIGMTNVYNSYNVDFNNKMNQNAMIDSVLVKESKIVFKKE